MEDEEWLGIHSVSKRIVSPSPAANVSPFHARWSRLWGLQETWVPRPARLASLASSCLLANGWPAPRHHRKNRPTYQDQVRLFPEVGRLKKRIVLPTSTPPPLTTTLVHLGEGCKLNTASLQSTVAEKVQNRSLEEPMCNDQSPQ